MSIELSNIHVDLFIAVFFYEESETVKHFDAAVDYINKNPVAGVKLGKVHRIFSNGSDAKNLVTDSMKSYIHFMKAIIILIASKF